MIYHCDHRDCEQCSNIIGAIVKSFFFMFLWSLCVCVCVCDYISTTLGKYLWRSSLWHLVQLWKIWIRLYSVWRWKWKERAVQMTCWSVSWHIHSSSKDKFNKACRVTHLHIPMIKTVGQVYTKLITCKHIFIFLAFAGLFQCTPSIFLLAAFTDQLK